MQFALTPRQSECLAFLRRRMSYSDVAPTYQEIGDALGIKSKSGVHRLIHGLRERGHIDLMPGKERSMTLKEVA